MENRSGYNLSKNSIRLPYTREVAEICEPFSCEDDDLDEFFSKDAFLYDSELLGRTYAWIDADNENKILGLITLANDSVKSKHLPNPARNRIARRIPNSKRGLNFPAVLIGRLGVSADCRGKGMNIGSQILDQIKNSFRSVKNKTGCRFIVVDAYNNPRTLHFYEKNGFKPLYQTEKDERRFLEIPDDIPMKTRFMFFDLRLK